MKWVIINTVIGFIAALIVAVYQDRNKARMPFWYVVLYWMLFQLGLNVIEGGLGVR